MTFIAGTGTGEAGLIATLPTSIDIEALLRRAGSAIAPDGAVGRNVAGFSDVAAQRDAVWTMLHGFATGNTADLAASVAAMRYGFQHQAADGSFVNTIADAATSLSDDTFFLQSFAPRLSRLPDQRQLGALRGGAAVHAARPAQGDDLAFGAGAHHARAGRGDAQPVAVRCGRV